MANPSLSPFTSPADGIARANLDVEETLPDVTTERLHLNIAFLLYITHVHARTHARTHAYTQTHTHTHKPAVLKELR